MAYPILQLLNLLTDDRYILKLIYCKPILQPFLGGIIQTSHSPIIFSATPIASFINGTGMRDAADSNNINACLPVAVIYFAVVGMTSRGFSDDSWIQMCVREMGGYTRINPLTAALIFVSMTSSSAEVNTFVAETISCCSGRSWTQFFVKNICTIWLGLLLTSDFVSVILNFQGMSRQPQEKHPDDIVVNGKQQGAVVHLSCNSVTGLACVAELHNLLPWRPLSELRRGQICTLNLNRRQSSYSSSALLVLEYSSNFHSNSTDSVTRWHFALYILDAIRDLQCQGRDTLHGFRIGASCWWLPNQKVPCWAGSCTLTDAEQHSAELYKGFYFPVSRSTASA